MIRATLFLSGTVQRVGCRLATQQAARRLGLVGTVQNLDDGRVKIVVEGDEQVVRELPDEIRACSQATIKQVEWDLTGRVSGGFVDFEILR